MEHATVISLSSTSSGGSRRKDYNRIDKTIPKADFIVVNHETDKLKNNNGKLLDLERTPDHCEKVTCWMNACENEIKKLQKIDCLNEVKSTCIRYDFDKAPRSSTTTQVQSNFTRTTPLFSYMEQAKKSTNLKSPKLESCRLNGSNTHKNPSPSPESKKKELCNYLQLMKPGEKKHNFHKQHRRSTRVKKLDNAKKNDIKSYDEKNDHVKYPTLKSFKDLNMKINKLANISCNKRKAPETNKYLPLPPKNVYLEVVDFEDSVQDFVKNVKKSNGCLKNVENRRKFNFGMKLHQKFKKVHFSYKRINSLRSRGRIRNISLDKLLLRKSQLRRKARRKMIKQIQEQKAVKNTPKIEKILSPRCEIISVHANSDDENIDLKNFVDDMLELDKLSEEHRKSVIESRILASSSITNLINKRAKQEEDVQRALKIFSDLSNERRSCEEKENNQENMEVSQEDTQNSNSVDENENMKNLVTHWIISEHDYAAKRPEPNVEDKQTEEIEQTGKIEEVENQQSENEESEEQPENEEGEEQPENEKVEQQIKKIEEPSESESIEKSDCSISPVPIPRLEILPVSKSIEVKSLQRSLTSTNKKTYYGLQNWNSGYNSNRKLNHSVTISKKNGAVLCAFYQDFNLVLIQENFVSFWTQSALGNVLGSQNMWIPKGEIQRIALNSTYKQKKAMEMIISNETSVAYVELWSKEHKSDVREVPVADVFAIVYFWRLRQNGLDKKALQLENIKGFADDVQYCVLKCYPKIVVSWHSVQGGDKRTKIHSYHLAADFQTVANISEIQPVEHHVTSLHNIEDCDNLVMGYGDNKITLWNVEYGYIVATVEMSAIKPPLSTLCVKCDRGFLFIIQECLDQELRLIAVNGMNHSWKKLQSYNPIQEYNGLKGVCIENGILVAYYSQGILCWNAQTGELIVEEAANECEYIPSGKHVIMIVDESIIVRHSLSHLITDL